MQNSSPFVAFDLTLTEEFTVVHSITVPLEMLNPAMQRPMVPFWINGIAPPLPLARRVYAAGQMVRSAIELAAITTEDPHQGMPDAGELGSIDTDLQMYSEDVAKLETPLKIEMARRAEEAALSADPRISNSEGA